MEFWPKLVVVQEINLEAKEVAKKQRNMVPSSTMFHLQFVEHKIYNCPHKDVTKVMFK